MRWLAGNPMLGRTRNEVKEGYRSFREGGHIVFYRVVEGTIEIIGVPHQNMDVEQNLGEEDYFFTTLRRMSQGRLSTASVAVSHTNTSSRLWSIFFIDVAPRYPSRGSGG